MKLILLALVSAVAFTPIVRAESGDLWNKSELGDGSGYIMSNSDGSNQVLCGNNGVCSEM